MNSFVVKVIASSVFLALVVSVPSVRCENREKNMLKERLSISSGLQGEQLKNAQTMLSQAKSAVPQQMAKLLEKKEEEKKPHCDCITSAAAANFKKLTDMLKVKYRRCLVKLDARENNIDLGTEKDQDDLSSVEEDEATLCEKMEFPGHKCISDRNLGYIESSFYADMTGNTAYIFYEV